MTYLSDKANKKRKGISYVLYAALFFVVLFAWPLFKKFVAPVVVPGAGKYAEVKSSFSVLPEFLRTYMTSHRELVEKDKALETEVEKLENEVAEKDAALREFSALSSASSGEGSILQKPLVMYPLIQDPLHLYSTILLSKGYKDGIDIGDRVFVRGRQVVCTIKEVYTSSSLCLLLTSSGATTEGVTSSSSIALSLVGRGSYYLGSVVRDSSISIGEKVYLRDNPSMTLGTVTDISHNNQDTSWYVFVRGAYNPVTSSIFYAQK